MKTAIAFALAAGKLAAAHATFQSFVIDGKDQGGKAVRTPSNGNNPILDVTSSAMTCNGGTAAANTIEVSAGSEIGLQWHHNQGAPSGADADEPIAASHKGPVMVYIAPAESNGEGDVWVKIQEDGLTGSTWGVDNFIKNKGLVNVKIPQLAAGDYLIRPEIIALHEASAQGKAQLYNGCGQIKVTGSGSTSLPSSVAFPGAYSATDPGILCNIYGGAVSCTADKSAGYDVPGPKVWDGASSGPGSGSGSGSPSPSPTTSPTPVTSAPAATSSAAAAPAQPTATAGAGSGSGSGSGSTLPETFTISEFISWLETKTGSATAKRFARAFVDRTHSRDFA